MLAQKKQKKKQQKNAHNKPIAVVPMEDVVFPWLANLHL